MARSGFLGTMEKPDQSELGELAADQTAPCKRPTSLRFVLRLKASPTAQRIRLAEKPASRG